jgi:iron(III) transport system substrate-binding protein
MRHRRVARAAVLLWLACTPGSGPRAAERVPLTVYTALEVEQQPAFKAAIEAAVPEVEVVWVYGQTGVVTERVRAEREAPRADLILGLGATSLIALEREGLLLPYKPRDADALRAPFRDDTPPYTWTGMDAYLGVACVNEEVAARERISVPSAWTDLLAPGFHGRIAMPDPVRTGTGYLLVAGWLQSMGEAQGWAFMDALHQNVAGYLATGAAPCVEAAEGRHLVGLTYDMRAVALKQAGRPIRIVVPIDGVGWEMEAFAIPSSTPHAALAKRVADWAASAQANALYAETFAIVAHPAASDPPRDYPPYAEGRMARNDLHWMAGNRTRVLAEWTRRYGDKVVP